MEYLNPAPAPILPQAMWLTYRVVMERPGLNADEVLDLAVPTAMRGRTPSEGSHVKRALDGLQRLGLVQNESGKVSAARVGAAEDFLRLLRRRIVSPPETFGAAFDVPEDLRRGLIWLTRQAPTKALNFELDIEPTTSVFTNPTRWNIFRFWSDALGFSRPALLTTMSADLRQAGSLVIPNPTGAVIDAIRAPFGEPLPRGQQIPITRLVDFLREEIPVLPGHPSATYNGLTGKADEALRALGLALTNAEERQILDLTYQSDPSRVMALPDAHDGRPRYVSAVTIRK